MKAVLFALVCMATLLSEMNGLRFAAHATYGDVVLTIVVAFWVISAPLVKHRRIHASVAISLALFSMVLALQFLLDSRADGGAGLLGGYYRLVIAWYLVPYLILDSLKSNRDFNVLVVVYVVGALANVLFSFAQLFGIGSQIVSVATVHDYEFAGRFHGLTMHPNHMGQICAVAFCLMLGTPIAKRGRGARLARWVALLITLIGVLGTGSRAALIAVLLSLIIFLNRPGQGLGRRVRASLSVLFLGVSVAIGITYLSDDHGVVGAFHRLVANRSLASASNDARYQFYLKSIAEFFTSPVAGAGFDLLGRAENLLIQFAEASGLIGLAALSLYMLPFLRSAKRQIQGRLLSNQYLVATLGVSTYLAVTMFQNETIGRFTMVPMGLLWYAQLSKPECKSAER